MNSIFSKFGRLGLTAALFLLIAPITRAASARGGAADFPPGTFSDGGHYKLSDFEGKVLVLFFYEQECPTCRGLIPMRNKVVDQFKDKPVKFLAVGPGDSLADVTGYVKGTHLEMPSFADALGVMQYRYGQRISLQNIYQFRIISPEGRIVGQTMEPADIERAVQSVKWKYKDQGYDPKLNGIINLLEWNQYEPALRQLRPLAKAKSATGESAAKLLDAVRGEGQAWLAEAGKASEAENPVGAFDLYTKVLTCFAGEDLSKQADSALKTLRKSKAVTDELAARQMFTALDSAMSRATNRQRAEVAAYCIGISKKYPDSPTGKKAADLAKEIELAAVAFK